MNESFMDEIELSEGERSYSCLAQSIARTKGSASVKSVDLVCHSHNCQCGNVAHTLHETKSEQAMIGWTLCYCNWSEWLGPVLKDSRWPTLEFVCADCCGTGLITNSRDKYHNMSNFDTWADEYTSFQRAIYNTFPPKNDLLNNQPPLIDTIALIEQLQKQIVELKQEVFDLKKNMSYSTVQEEEVKKTRKPKK